jgi:hypothetical protein
VHGEQLAQVCLVLGCDEQGTRAEGERGTRLRMLIANQFDPETGSPGLLRDQFALQDRNAELDTNDIAHDANVPLAASPGRRVGAVRSVR